MLFDIWLVIYVFVCSRFVIRLLCVSIVFFVMLVVLLVYCRNVRLLCVVCIGCGVLCVLSVRVECSWIVCGRW